MTQLNGAVTGAERSDALARPAVGIAVVGLIVMLYFTLFPFDFVDQGRSPDEIVRRFTLGTGSPWALREVPANILLTIPLGYGVGGLVRLRSSSTPKIVAVTTTCVLVLSSGVELAQSAWLLRDPSIDDIVANAAGGALGAWLWTRSESWLRAVRRSTSVAPVGVRRLLWLIVGILPAVVLTAATIAHRTDSELAGWDQRFPLVLGNEPTGNRPWRGSIARVSLADRAFADDEIERLLDGARMSHIAPRSTLVDHDFRDDPAVPAGWRVGVTDEPSAAAFSPRGLELGAERWVQTEPPDGVSRRLDAANSFTLLVDATTASSTQTGPARLVSISSDPQRRNLTIAQDGSDLVIRVRTAFTGDNGLSPEFVLPGVFRDGASRRLITTYRPSELRVTVDHVADTSSITLLPETVPLFATFIDEVSQLRFSAVGRTLRQIFFATIMFAPWIVCVAMAFPQRRGRGELIAVVILPIVFIEAIFASILPGHPFRAGFVLTTAVAAFLVVFAMRRPLRRA